MRLNGEQLDNAIHLVEAVENRLMPGMSTLVAKYLDAAPILGRALREVRAAREHIAALTAALGEASYHIEWSHSDEHAGHLLVEKFDALLVKP